MNVKNVALTIAVALFVTGGMYFLQKVDMGAGDGASVITTQYQANLGEFASCISNSGAKFYGAFWCSHCQNQKKMFGEAADLLPYVECSTPEGEQTQVCADAGITAYPTWEFPGGERISGEMSFEVLAEKTSCAMPTETTTE